MACVDKNSKEYKQMVARVGNPILAEYYLLNDVRDDVYKNTVKKIADLKSNLGIYSRNNLTETQKKIIYKNLGIYNKQNKSSHEVHFQEEYPGRWEIHSIIYDEAPVNREKQIEGELSKIAPGEQSVTQAKLRDELNSLRGKQLELFSREDIKSGVPELFESNPELANKVYEVMGFGKPNYAEFETSTNPDVIKTAFKHKTLIGLSPDYYFGNTISALEKSRKVFKEWDKHKPDNYTKLGSFYFDAVKVQTILDKYNIETPLRQFIQNSRTIDYEGNEQLAINELYGNKGILKDITPQQKQQAQQLYSQYLDTIFPDSKVKDIVYHGSDNNFDKFDSTKKGNRYGLFSTDSNKGIFFGNKNLATQFAFKDDLKQQKGALYPVLLNTINPLIRKEDYQAKKDLINYIKEIEEILAYANVENTPKDILYFYGKSKNIEDLKIYLNKQKDRLNNTDFTKGVFFSKYMELDIKEAISNSKDAIIWDYQVDDLKNNIYSPEYVVFEPEQIHILGSEKDIEGFKEFVNKKSAESEFDKYILEKNVAKDTIILISDKLQERFGIKYKIISSEEAKKISDKYTDEAAFYSLKNKTVYFVEGRLNINTAFHEFAHPFVEAIFKHNPELAEKLFNDLSQTKEGKDLIEEVRRQYPEYLESGKPNTYFYQEVLVKAIAKLATQNINPETGKPFISALKRILRELKNLIERLFKKDININELDPNTSLQTIADIISVGTNRVNLVYNEEELSQTTEGETNVLFTRGEPKLVQYSKINQVYEPNELSEQIDKISTLADHVVMRSIPNAEKMVDNIHETLIALSKGKKDVGKYDATSSVAQDIEKLADGGDFVSAIVEYAKDVLYHIYGGQRIAYQGYFKGQPSGTRIEENYDGILTIMKRLEDKIINGTLNPEQDVADLETITDFVYSYNDVFMSLRSSFTKEMFENPNQDRVFSDLINNICDIVVQVKDFRRKHYVSIMSKWLGTEYSAERNKRFEVDESGNPIRFAPEKSENASIEEIVSVIDRDVASFTDVWINNIASTKSELLQIIDKKTKALLRRVYFEVLEDSRDLLSIVNGVTNFDFLYEKLDGKLTGNIISMYNRELFARERSKFYTENPKPERSEFENEGDFIDASIKHRKVVAQWYRENCKVVPLDLSIGTNTVSTFLENVERLGDEHEDLKRIVAEKQKSLSSSAFAEWVGKTIGVTYEEMEVEGNVHLQKVYFFSYETSTPSDKYLNKDYKKLTKKQKEIVGFVSELKAKYSSKLGGKALSHFRMPQMRKDVWETLVGRGGPKGVWKKIGEGFVITEQDIDKVVVESTDFRGNPRRTLPVHYTKELPSMDLLSTDAPGVLIEFMNMAAKYSVMNKNLPLYRMLKEGFEGEKGETPMTKVVQRNSLENKVMARIGRKKKLEQKYMRGNESNVYKMLEHYMEMVVFGHTSSSKGSINIPKYLRGKLTNEKVEQIVVDIKNGMSDVDLKKKYKITNKIIKDIREHVKTMQYAEDTFSLKYQVNSQKIMDSLLGWTALTQLAGNMYAGLSNVLNGVTMQSIEAKSGRFFDHKTWGIAQAKYTTLMADYARQIGSANNTSKLSLWIEYFDVGQSYKIDGKVRKSNRKRMLRLMDKDILMLYTRAGEHYLMCTTSLAMAYKTKLKDKNGKLVPLFECYEKNGNKLILKEEFRGQFTEQDRNNFIYKQSRILNELNGVYNEVDKMWLQFTAFGRFLIMYRKWIKPGWNRRWDGMRFDHGMDMWREGYYRTGLRFIKDIALTKLAVKSTFSELTPYQKDNLKRFSWEMSLLAGIGILLLALFGDDDDKNNAEALAEYYLKRLTTEMMFYWNPSEFFKIVRSPAAGLETLTNAYTVFSWILVPINWGYMTEKIKSGKNKGLTRIEAKMLNLIPIWDNVRDYKHAKQKLKMFTNQSAQFN